MNVEEEIKRLKEDIRRLTGRFPKNSVTSTEEGHVHTALAAAGGGTGTASGGLVHYDYIIDANYTGAAGASVTLLNGSTSILYATIQAAVTAANTDRQTTNQNTSFLINAGTYTVSSAISINPPNGGAYQFYGESRERVTIQPGAGSITLFNATNNFADDYEAQFVDLGFTHNNQATVKFISGSTSSSIFVQRCLFDTNATGTAIDGPNASYPDTSIKDCHFKGTAGTAIEMGETRFKVLGNFFDVDVGISFTNSGAGGVVVGNRFLNNTTAIIFNALETRIDITGNFFEVSP